MLNVEFALLCGASTERNTNWENASRNADLLFEVWKSGYPVAVHTASRHKGEYKSGLLVPVRREDVTSFNLHGDLPLIRLVFDGYEQESVVLLSRYGKRALLLLNDGSAKVGQVAEITAKESVGVDHFSVGGRYYSATFEP